MCTFRLYYTCSKNGFYCYQEFTQKMYEKWSFPFKTNPCTRKNSFGYTLNNSINNTFEFLSVFNMKIGFSSALVYIIIAS